MDSDDGGRWLEVWHGGDDRKLKQAARALDAEGIPVRIAGSASGSWHARSGSRLLVPEQDHARAKSLVPKSGFWSKVGSFFRIFIPPIGPRRSL